MRRFPLHRLCETFSIISAILQQFGVCSKNNGPSVLTTPDAEDTFDQLCEISYDLRSDVERTGMDFEYWYAVGSVGPLTGRTLFKLEQLLYTSIEEEKLWCTYIYPIEQVEGSEVLQRGFERLGVVTFTPGASDELTEFSCPGTGDADMMASSGATHCTVIRGGMAIMDHPVYRIGNAAIVLREIVQRNINSPGAFVADNVEFLAYLGDNEGDALSGIAPGGSGGGDAENNAGKTLNNESEENDGRKGGFAFVLAIGVPIAVVALASLFSARNDRKKAFNRIFEQPIEEKVLSIENGDDPPGSFHEGMHHYMRDGTRYYSANCDQCREYNCVVLLDDNSFISPVKMEFVPENEAFDRSEQGKILPRPDVGLGLSQQHMGINVHKCKSATCNHCAPNSPYPTFVSTGVAAREANNDSSTSSSSPISTINSSTARSSVQSATFGSLFTDLATPTCVTIEKVADA